MNSTVINIFWMVLGGGIVFIVCMLLFKAYRAGIRDSHAWSQSQDD